MVKKLNNTHKKKSINSKEDLQKSEFIYKQTNLYFKCLLDNYQSLRNDVKKLLTILTAVELFLFNLLFLPHISLLIKLVLGVIILIYLLLSLRIKYKIDMPEEIQTLGNKYSTMERLYINGDTCYMILSQANSLDKASTRQVQHNFNIASAYKWYVNFCLIVAIITVLVIFGCWFYG